jgi:hypothetical protein
VDASAGGGSVPEWLLGSGLLPGSFPPETLVITAWGFVSLKTAPLPLVERTCINGVVERGNFTWDMVLTELDAPPRCQTVQRWGNDLNVTVYPSAQCEGPTVASTFFRAFYAPPTGSSYRQLPFGPYIDSASPTPSASPSPSPTLTPTPTPSPPPTLSPTPTSTASNGTALGAGGGGGGGSGAPAAAAAAAAAAALSPGAVAGLSIGMLLLGLCIAVAVGVYVLRSRAAAAAGPAYQPGRAAGGGLSRQAWGKGGADWASAAASPNSGGARGRLQGSPAGAGAPDSGGLDVVVAQSNPLWRDRAARSASSSSSSSSGAGGAEGVASPQ